MVLRTGNSAQLTVDGTVYEYTGTGSVGLTVTTPLYIGGAPDYGMLHTETGFFEGFQGCLENFQVGMGSRLPGKGSSKVF